MINKNTVNLIDNDFFNNNSSTSNQKNNVDDIFSSSLNRSNSPTKTSSNQTNIKSQSDIMAQIDFLSSGSGGTVNNQSGFQINFTNSSNQVFPNTTTNFTNKTNSQYTPFPEFGMSSVSPNNFNSGPIINEVNQSKLDFNQGNNLIGNSYQGNQNFGQGNDVSMNKSQSSVQNENELKKKLLNNNKLVDLNNLFNTKKEKVEEKTSNTNTYAFTGTPLNLIKVEEKGNNLNIK